MTSMQLAVKLMGVLGLCGCAAVDSTDLYMPFGDADLLEETPLTEHAVAQSAPLLEVADLSQDFFDEGLQIDQNYGIGVYIPNDRYHTWHMGNDFGQNFHAAAKDAIALAQSQVPWTLEETDSTQTSDVLFYAQLSLPSDECTGVVKGTCWTGSTGCSRYDDNILFDDGHRICLQWTVHLAVNNILAYAEWRGFDEHDQIETIVMHEFGHSLGFSHLGKSVASGIMRPIIQVSDMAVGYTPCELAQLRDYQFTEAPGLHIKTTKECQ